MRMVIIGVTSLLLSAGMAGSPVAATDWIVDGTLANSTATHFRTIAEALLVCQDGDRVLVRAQDDSGNAIVYHEENLIVEHSIELRSLESTGDQPVRATIRGPFPMHLDNYDPDDPVHVAHARAQQAIDFPQQKPVIRITTDQVTLSWLAVEGSTKVGILARSLDESRLTNVMIRNCSTFMTFSSGILLHGVDKAEISDCVVRRACQYGWQECITLNDTHSFDVSNNVVFDRPYLQIPFEIPADENSEILKQNGRAIVRGGEGIDAKSGSRHGLIQRNLVASINKFGIYVDGYDKESFDIRISRNFIYNVGSGIAVASENNGYTHDITIDGNIVALCRAGLYVNDHGRGDSHAVTNLQIHYNTFFANRVGGMVITNPDLLGLAATNNISVNNGGTDLKIDAKGGTWLYFSNNLIGKARFAGVSIEPGFYDPSQLFLFAASNQLVPDQDVINADVVWDPAHWDVPWEDRLAQIYLWDHTLYQPSAGSPAIDQGNAEFALPDSDVFRNKRNIGFNPADIGAVELPY